jgi:hypothetical protein
MTDMTKTSRPKCDENDTSTVAPVANVTEAQALITEQQVLLSTAAVVALPPAKTRRWSDAIRAISGALRAVFASSEKPPARRHYPKRHVWLENSLMSREMDRL